MMNTEIQVQQHINRIIRALKIPKDIKCFLAGGSMLHFFTYGEWTDPKDYDIFSYSLEDFNKLVLYFGVHQHFFESDNSLTYLHKEVRPKVQLIKTQMGKPLEVINNFDFTICAVAYDFSTDKYYYHNLWHTDVRQKNLRLSDDRQRQYSHYRVAKYRNKGYKPLFELPDLCNKCTDTLLCLTQGESICQRAMES